MKRPVQAGTLRFIFIAVVLMLLMDQFVFGGKRSYIENAKTAKVVEQQEEVLSQEVFSRPDISLSPQPSPQRGEGVKRATPKMGRYFELVPEIKSSPQRGEDLGEGENKSTAIAPPPHPDPLPKGAREYKGGKRKIAIIIDDLGMDVKHTKEVMELPAPITLAFLPYAPRTRELAAVGKAKGHELIIHTPMEAMDANLNIGPGGLKANMSVGEFQAAFGKMMGSFDGYVGINNHMGSRLTQDKEAMDRLMNILSSKDLFFVDSKTIQSSVAAREAAVAGVKFAERDVFLDHVESRAFVDKALAQAERTAARKGYAIAIGHPKSFTIEGLKAWMPTLAAKGIELVPVSALLVTPSRTTVIPNPKGEESLSVLQEDKIPPAGAPPFGMTEEETPAPSVDMFPETPLDTSVPSAPASEGTVLWSPPPPTQSPAP